MFSKKKYNSCDFICVSCLNTVISPIFKCPNEHFLCSRCERMSDECPVCKDGPGRRKRSARIERIAGKTKFSCPNSQYGCVKQISGRKISIHEQTECDYQAVNCPMCPDQPPRYSWVSFLRHFRYYHQCEQSFSDSHSTNIYRYCAFDTNRFDGYLLFCHQYFFIIIVEPWLQSGDTFFYNVSGKCIHSLRHKKSASFRLEINCERLGRKIISKVAPIGVLGESDPSNDEVIIDLHFKTIATMYIMNFKIVPN